MVTFKSGQKIATATTHTGDVRHMHFLIREDWIKEYSGEHIIIFVHRWHTQAKPCLSKLKAALITDGYDDIANMDCVGMAPCESFDGLFINITFEAKPQT